MSEVVEEIPAGLDGERLDRVVSFVTGLPRAAAADLVAGGHVRLGESVVTTKSTRVVEGQTVAIELPEVGDDPRLQPDPTVEVPIVHVDEGVIVVDKPADLVVHPGAGVERGTMAQGLLAAFPELAGVGQPDRPGIVHRLDKGTTGLLVVARVPEAYADLVDQLAARTVTRRYRALAWGHLAADAGLVDAPVGRSARTPTKMAVSIRGREARTRYKVIERFNHPTEVTDVGCQLETGRTHQIRVHLAAIGHPVVGDDTYRGRREVLEAPRPMLHAAELAFTHPLTGETLSFESPLPDDFLAVRAQLA